MATPTQTDRIAASFVAVLRAWLTKNQWKTMCARNRDEGNPRVCHSHDFCDANLAMVEAFKENGIATIDIDDGNQLALWNAAWERAMPALSAK